MFDPRRTDLLAEVPGDRARVARHPHYAALAVFPQLANEALVPGENAIRSASTAPPTAGSGASAC